MMDFIDDVLRTQARIKGDPKTEFQSLVLRDIKLHISEKRLKRSRIKKGIRQT